jgi:hypothetical protein
MSIGTDLAYGLDGLRTGAAGLTGVVDDTEQAMSALRGAPLVPGMFGLTAAGAVYAAVLEAVRGVRTRGLAQESGRAGDLGGRASTAAGLGDELTRRSGQVAGAATPGAPS